MGWRARWDTSSPDVGPGCFTNCAKESWRHYINDSAVTAVIISTDENATAIACAAHALGKRTFTVHGMSFGDFNTSKLHNMSYTRAWVVHGVKNTRALYPWSDGVNLDLEHFPAADNEKGDLTRMQCCGAAAALHRPRAVVRVPRDLLHAFFQDLTT